MGQKQPPTDTFSFKQQLHAVNWLIHLGALTPIVITRWDVGFRFLNPFHLIGTALAMLAIAGLTDDQTKRPFDLAVFAVVMLVAALIQKFTRWREIGRGIRRHSYYLGTSCFQFHWLPDFLKRNRRMARFVDPLVLFGVGLAIVSVSNELGVWIMVTSLCLRLFEYQTWRQWMFMNLDLVDGTVLAELQSDAVETFTTQPPQHQQHDDGAIPTGMGEDIQEKIKRRKQNRKS